MDQTPITLNSESSLQLAVNMFQRLGLRYLLFVQRGALKGLLTKKDLWCLLSAKENREGNGDGEGFVAGVGVLREEGGNRGVDGGDGEEERGLLAAERGVAIGDGRARSNTIDTLESR